MPSWNFCSVTAIGLDITCPMCGVEVKSGQHHECHGPQKREDPRIAKLKAVASDPAATKGEKANAKRLIKRIQNHGRNQ